MVNLCWRKQSRGPFNKWSSSKPSETEIPHVAFAVIPISDVLGRVGTKFLEILNARKSGLPRVGSLEPMAFGSVLGKASGKLPEAVATKATPTKATQAIFDGRWMFRRFAEMKSPIIFQWTRNYKRERMIIIIFQRFWEK